MKNNRLESNLKILKKLEEYFLENPQIRFFQGLWNVGIVSANGVVIMDKYSEESDKTFNKLMSDG